MNLENVRTLRLLLAQLDERVSEIDGGTEEVANLVLELNLAKVELGIVYDQVSGLLGNLMVDDPLIELRDGAQVERKMGQPEKAGTTKTLPMLLLTESSSPQLTWIPAKWSSLQKKWPYKCSTTLHLLIGGWGS